MSVAEAEAALRPVDEDLPVEERVRLALQALCRPGPARERGGRHRIPDSLLAPGEEELDRTLRPRRLAEFVGQEAIKEQLSIFLEAARARGEPCEHVLLAGPPGLGKTSLAAIIAAEMGSALRVMSGPAIDRKADMAAILTALEPDDVLFIDEIHRLNRSIEELLYPAMEDGFIDIVIGQGPGAHSIRLDLAPFTLVGATTRTGLLTTPLRDRFGITHRLDHYGRTRSSGSSAARRGILGVEHRRRRLRRDRAPLARHAAGGQPDPAPRARLRPGAPRRRDHHARWRSRRWSCSRWTTRASSGSTARSCSRWPRRSPAGRWASPRWPSRSARSRDTLEDVYEPYLLQLGLLQRTPRGRVVTPRGVRAPRAARAGPRSAPVLNAVIGAHAATPRGLCACTSVAPAGGRRRASSWRCRSPSASRPSSTASKGPAFRVSAACLRLNATVRQELGVVTGFGFAVQGPVVQNADGTGSAHIDFSANGSWRNGHVHIQAIERHRRWYLEQPAELSSRA